MKSANSTKRWSLQGRRFREWLAPLLIAIVAIGASISGISNEFAQDDVPLVLEDERVHTLTRIPEIVTGSYWPAPFSRDLYRPLATFSFAVQWVVGDGAPAVYRIISYFLYVLVSLAVFLLAKRMLPDGPALAVGLLFAAHPVHVEAVALAVNQGEQWVALLTVVGVARYLDLRRHGWIPPKAWVGIGAIYLVACLFKEHAIMLPGLLLAAEFTLLNGAARRDRVTRLWPGFALLGGIGALFLGLRSAILGGFVGSFTAEALHEQAMSGRTLTMLQVVPEWVRLLAWPTRLQGDYSPAVIDQASSWGVAQSLGLAILLALVAIGLMLWRRSPVVPFGLLWAGLTLLPVSNVLIPTGITLAERTLFLPSIGFLLAAIGIAVPFIRGEDRGPARRLAVVALALLVVAGTTRSALRHRDWRTHTYYWAQTVEDAPLSYRAHHALAQILWSAGYRRDALLSFHTAMALYPRTWWIRNELANRFRELGECHPALQLYEESLRINPEQPGVRASRVACHLHLGQYDEAISEADTAITLGLSPDDFRSYRAVADSARRVGAPAGSVRLTVADPEERW